jgi:hypothetical protein
VDDACGSTGYSGRKIVLLDQQGLFTGTGALACDSYAIDTAANHHDVKVATFEGASLVNC